MTKDTKFLYSCLYCNTDLEVEMVCLKCGQDTVKKKTYKSFYKILK